MPEKFRHFLTMKIILYKNISNKNVLTKKITKMGELDNVNILDYSQNYLELNFSFSTDINFNYIYIPDFEKYYFVERIEIAENDIKNYNCKCDVLTSNKEIVMKSKIKCDGNTKFFNVSDIIIDRTPTNILLTLNRTN